MTAHDIAFDALRRLAYVKHRTTGGLLAHEIKEAARRAGCADEATIAEALRLALSAHERLRVPG